MSNPLKPAARASLICAFVLVLSGGVHAYEWNPTKQYNYAQNYCRTARSATDKDACQYYAERLVSALTDCIREGSPYARQCAQMLPGARRMHAGANNDPTLLQHRQRQRDSQRAYQDEQLRRGPSGILNYPNYNRTCAQQPNGQYSCY